MRHFDHRGEGADAQPPAATRDQRMHIDHGFAPVELFEDRLVGGVAEPFVAVVGLQIDAVGLQRIEGVFDLFQRQITSSIDSGANRP